MKKVLYVCFLCFTLILLTGCAQNNQNVDNSYTTTKTNYTGKTENNIKENSDNVNNNNQENTIPNISTQPVSTFTTKIYDKSTGRMANLKLAGKKLTGIVVKSGEVFSFNDKMGPYNQSQGFEKAKIFSSTGNVLEEYGGGICQISTTLYNALLPLNVEIVERHKHSKKVQYIQNGKDATLSYGHLDFKFKNTTDYDMEFSCNVTENEVKININRKD